MKKYTFLPEGSRRRLTITVGDDGIVTMGQNAGATNARKARAWLNKMGQEAFLRECCTEWNPWQYEIDDARKKDRRGGMRTGAGRPKGKPTTSVSFNLEDDLLGKWRALPDKGKTLNAFLRQRLGEGE